MKVNRDKMNENLGQEDVGERFSFFVGDAIVTILANNSSTWKI